MSSSTARDKWGLVSDNKIANKTNVNMDVSFVKNEYRWDLLYFMYCYVVCVCVCITAKIVSRGHKTTFGESILSFNIGSKDQA